MSEFLQTPAGIATGVFVAIFGLVGLVYALSRVYMWLKLNRQGYWNEDVIEAALLPYLYQAIMTAYKISERMMDGVGDRLRGMKKAEIAQAVYQYLPDTVSLAGIAWYWKDHVSEAQFSRWLEKRFIGFADLWEKASGGLLSEIRVCELGLDKCCKT